MLLSLCFPVVTRLRSSFHHCRIEVKVEKTAIALAFTLDGQQPAEQEVYAYLPVRRYGLNFVVQVGDVVLGFIVLHWTLLASSETCIPLLCSFEHVYDFTNSRFFPYIRVAFL